MNIYYKVFLSTILSLFLASCGGAQRMDSDKDIVSDSGGLTRQEMEKAGEIIGKKINAQFKKNPPPGGVFLALLTTKNNTSEQIPTDVFDNSLISELTKNKIYTLKTEKRADQLKEVKTSQLLGGDINFTVKSPNYFVQASIDENLFTSDGDKIAEQILNVQLIEVGTLQVAINEKQVYRKKAASRGGAGW